MGQDCLKMWQHRPHTVSKRERERQREREREREREIEREAAGHVQDGSPDFGVYQVYARRSAPFSRRMLPAQGGVVRAPTD